MIRATLLLAVLALQSVENGFGLLIRPKPQRSPLFLLKKTAAVNNRRRRRRNAAAAAAFINAAATGSSGVMAGIGLVGGAAAVAKTLQERNGQQELFTPTAGSLAGQTIVITGASTGLGLESAKRLAVGGANLILTVRSADKGIATVDAVKEYLSDKGITMNEDEQLITYKVLDLDNLKSVKRVPESWKEVKSIDVLLNNAGIMALPNRELTVDGYERQMQSNHLGHFAFTALLSSKFSDNAKIISVSSSAHKMASQGLDFDYMWKAEQGYEAWKSYGQSKLANIHFTKELQRRATAAGKEWTAITLHPGVVNTDLGRYSVGETIDNNSSVGSILDFLNTNAKPLVELVSNATNVIGFKTPEQGATTQVYLAAGGYGDDDDVARGQFFVDCKARVLDEFATRESDAAQLWEDSERLTGIEFKFE